LKSIGAALCKTPLLRDLCSLAALFLKELLHIPELALVALDGLVGLGVGLVGVVESDFEFVDVGLQLLLDTEALGLGSGLGLK